MFYHSHVIVPPFFVYKLTGSTISCFDSWKQLCLVPLKHFQTVCLFIIFCVCCLDFQMFVCNTLKFPVAWQSPILLACLNIVNLKLTYNSACCDLNQLTLVVLLTLWSAMLLVKWQNCHIVGYFVLSGYIWDSSSMHDLVWQSSLAPHASSGWPHIFWHWILGRSFLLHSGK